MRCGWVGHGPGFGEPARDEIIDRRGSSSVCTHPPTHTRWPSIPFAWPLHARTGSLCPGPHGRQGGHLFSGCAREPQAPPSSSSSSPCGCVPRVHGIVDPPHTHPPHPPPPHPQQHGIGHGPDQIFGGGHAQGQGAGLLHEARHGKCPVGSFPPPPRFSRFSPYAPLTFSPPLMR